MPKFTFDLMTVKLQYCWKKTGSTLLYYRRRIPDDLKPLIGRRFVVVSLQTSDPKVAAAKIRALAKKHDDEFKALRTPTRAGNNVLADKILADVVIDPVRPHEESFMEFEDVLHEKWVEGNGKVAEPYATVVQKLHGNDPYMLADCRDDYVKFLGEDDDGRPERAYRYLLEYLKTDRAISDLRRTDVNGFVQFLLDTKQLSTSSVQRYIAPIKASFNHAISERELPFKNVFDKIKIPKLGSDVVDREVFTLAQFKLLDTALVSAPQDTLRSIALVLSESGARLAEVVGLAKTDVKLTAAVPHIALKPHPWRTLKTPGSTRKIPLTPRAVESLKAAIARSSDPTLVFPQYCTTEADGCNADTASAALVKWLRSRDGLKGTKLGNHSMRHGMKDLLRAVDCQGEPADQILGHATEGMGANYGEGYPLEKLYDWIVAANALKTQKPATV